jgi:hypothetical protein
MLFLVKLLLMSCCSHLHKPKQVAKVQQTRRLQAASPTYLSRHLQQQAIW